MRQQISDTDIDAAIAQLYGNDTRWSDGFPCVRDVAQRLKETHGAAGTNERICKALKRARSYAVSRRDEIAPDEWRIRALQLVAELERHKATTLTEMKDLRLQLDEALARAERAEHRELSHQGLWAAKNMELQERLKEAELRRPRGVPEEKYLNLLREFTAMRIEHTQLKEESRTQI